MTHSNTLTWSDKVAAFVTNHCLRPRWILTQITDSSEWELQYLHHHSKEECNGVDALPKWWIIKANSGDSLFIGENIELSNPKHRNPWVEFYARGAHLSYLDSGALGFLKPTMQTLQSGASRFAKLERPPSLTYGPTSLFKVQIAKTCMLKVDPTCSNVYSEQWVCVGGEQ